MIKKFLFIILSVFFLALTLNSALAVLNDAEVYFSFDESDTSGTVMFDLSSNSRNGTCNMNSNCDTVEGLLLNSSDFDGTNDYIAVDNGLSIASGSDKTVAMWVNIDGVSGSDYLLDENSATRFIIGLNPSSTGNYELYDGTAWRDTGQSYSTGSWEHIAFSIGSSGTALQFYFNGANVYNATVTAGGLDTFDIGEVDSGTGSNYDGTIDEFGVWGRALSSTEISELYNSGTGFNPYATTPTSNDNFSTVSSASYSFDTPISIGTSYGVVNSLTYNNSITDTEPFYFSTSLTTFGGSDTANCRITVDGVGVVNNTRSLSTGTYGNIVLVSPAENLSLGLHTINTECRKIGGSNYVVNNSQLTQFLLYDAISNSSITSLTFDDDGPISVNTTDSYLGSFSFTTSNTTNTTNVNYLVTQGMVNYNYVVDDNLTTYFKIIETGEICGPYTRGGNAGTTGSVGASCLFKNLSSSTTYNLSLYGYTENGAGSLTSLSSNLYEIKVNNSAGDIVSLNKTIPANTLTLIETINISNVLGGNYNVFSEASLMVNSYVTQDAYFYLSNTVNTSNFYRTLSNDGKNGNIVIQNLFSESGTGTKSVSLYGYCPSGCEVNGGDLTAFVTDSSTASTGTFDITAYNVYNDSMLSVFNATVGGAIYTTTNGTITALGQGSVSVTISATNFFSNTTSQDTTTNLNASLAKYTEIRAIEYITNNSVSNYTVNMTGATYTTTNGIAYLPIVDGTTVFFNSDDHAQQSVSANKTQYLNITVYATNSITITFKDSQTDSIVNNVSLDYWSNSDSGTNSTTDGTLYLTLLEPEFYTFRYNSTGYPDNFYFMTITDDTYSDLTLYLNSNTTDITIEVYEGEEPLENAYVQAQRFYVADNSYKTVAAGVTNPEGETVMSLETGSNFYKFVVNYNGETVKTTNPFLITGTTIRINVILGTPPLQTYSTLKDITGSVVFNENTNNFRYVFSDENLNNRQFCLNTYRRGSASDLLINNTCTTGSSGTILHSVTNSTGLSYYSIGTVVIDSKNYLVGQDTYTFPLVDLGGAALIVQILLTIAFATAGFLAVELIFIAVPISIIIGGMFGLHSIGIAFTSPLVVIGFFLMFLLRRNR